MNIGPGLPSNMYFFTNGNIITVRNAENQYNTITYGITLGSIISGMYKKATGPRVIPYINRYVNSDNKTITPVLIPIYSPPNSANLYPK